MQVFSALALLWAKQISQGAPDLHHRCVLAIARPPNYQLLQILAVLRLSCLLNLQQFPERGTPHRCLLQQVADRMSPSASPEQDEKRGSRSTCLPQALVKNTCAVATQSWPPAALHLHPVSSRRSARPRSCICSVVGTCACELLYTVACHVKAVSYERDRSAELIC